MGTALCGRETRDTAEERPRVEGEARKGMTERNHRVDRGGDA